MTTLGYLRGVREWVYPTRTTSAFLEKGVLTPDEFVRAGDELVFRCPTWSWESGDPSKLRSYLPPEKQYLVTRNVPCASRVDEMEHQLAQALQKSTVRRGGGGENNNDDDDDDDDAEWLFSTLASTNNNNNNHDHQNLNTYNDGNAEDDFDIVDDKGEIVEKKQEAADSSQQPSSKEADQDNTILTNDDGYADMADFEDDNVLEDEDAATNTPAAGAARAGTNPRKGHPDDDDDDNLVKVRTYDISITYDKYYQTPRVWMVGTSATGQPLSAKEMMEDVMTDYANKTVTIENHPHVAGPHASIHPCQHGKVMKRIVQNLIRASEAARETIPNNDAAAAAEGHVVTGDEPTVEMYLFIFLKFVSSIIPTINYDFTMDVTASTQK